MIVRKTWVSKERLGVFNEPKYVYVGIFLLGIIPIYIKRLSNFN